VRSTIRSRSRTRSDSVGSRATTFASSPSPTAAISRRPRRRATRRSRRVAAFEREEGLEPRDWVTIGRAERKIEDEDEIVAAWAAEFRDERGQPLDRENPGPVD